MNTFVIHFELNSVFLKLSLKVTIPSTTVKSRFLKTLPVGTIYKDPGNGHSYIIEEKKINECLSKTGVPYIGSDAPIEIQVPDKYMKLDNPKRAKSLTLTTTQSHHQTVFIQLKTMEKGTAINPLKTTWFCLIVSWIWILNKQNLGFICLRNVFWNRYLNSGIHAWLHKNRHR